jgi:hypothetical protein
VAEVRHHCERGRSRFAVNRAIAKVHGGDFIAVSDCGAAMSGDTPGAVVIAARLPSAHPRLEIRPDVAQ